MSNEGRTYVAKTSTMIAVLNEYDEIDTLRLKGETYYGAGPYVHIPISCLEDVYLNEFPQGVGIYPVKNIGKVITPLDCPIPLMHDIIVCNSFLEHNFNNLILTFILSFRNVLSDGEKA